MAIYNQKQGLQSIFDAALGDYRSKGFSLGEEGDHIVVLYHNKVQVALFTQTGVTIPEVHKACRRHLLDDHAEMVNLVDQIDGSRRKAGI